MSIDLRVTYSQLLYQYVFAGLLKQFGKYSYSCFQFYLTLVLIGLCSFYLNCPYYYFNILLKSTISLIISPYLLLILITFFSNIFGWVLIGVYWFINNFDKTNFVFLKFYLTSISNLLISMFISILFLIIWGLICFAFFFFRLYIFFFFLKFIFISWRPVTLQYCSGFCHALTWISHGFTCIPHPDPPSHLPLYLIPLGLPSAPGPRTCLMHSTSRVNLDNMHVSMLFSRNIPPSPSPTESKSLFCTSGSLFLFCI